MKSRSQTCGNTWFKIVYLYMLYFYSLFHYFAIRLILILVLILNLFGNGKWLFVELVSLDKQNENIHASKTVYNRYKQIIDNVPSILLLCRFFLNKFSSVENVSIVTFVRCVMENNYCVENSRKYTKISQKNVVYEMFLECMMFVLI